MRAADQAEERGPRRAAPPAREVNFSDMQPTDSAARQKFRKLLRESDSDEKSTSRCRHCRRRWRFSATTWNSTSQIQGMFGSVRRPGQVIESRRLKALIEEKPGKLINDDELKANALANVEQNGIVFLDEIDKIASRQETIGADVSRQGVQRDLLAAGRGAAVTKYGMIQHRPHPVHRSRRLPPRAPVGPDPRVAGALPIRVRPRVALGRRLQEQILTATDASLPGNTRRCWRPRG